MSTELMLTLGTLIVVIIMFLSGKANFGFIGMFCSTLLCLVGVLDFNEAYGNFASTNVIMMSAMFIMAGALNKTSLVNKVRDFIMSRNTSGRTIVFLYLVGVILLTQLVSPLGVISMMLPLSMALGKDSPVSTSQLLYPGAVMSHATQALTPLGMGLTYYVTANALLEANGAAAYPMGMFDKCLSVILPATVTFIYFVFIGYKLFPKHEVDTTQIAEVKEKKGCDPRTEKIIYTVFIITMICLACSNYLPIPMHIIPIIADLVLAALGCLTAREAKNSINFDSVLMMAGLLCLSTAMQKTGAAQVVADTVVALLGGNPSPVMIEIAFLITGACLTQVMSNTATYNVLVPLAIMTAVARGFDPRGMVLAISLGTTGAMLTPMSSPSVAIAFGAGKYKLKEVFLPCLPAFILHTIAIFISVNLLYPLW